MGNGLIAFLVAMSSSVWIYSKVMRTTGNNTSNALKVALISAVVIFLISMMLLGLIPE